MSKSSSNQSNATVIRLENQPVDATVVPPSGLDAAKRSANTVENPEWSLDTGQQRALTQIYHALESSNNSAGFEIARQEANKALANNKIILNNRFVLDSIIGSGGMGTVYKARDLRKVEANAIDPHIAVKVLNEDFQNHPDAFVTLQREANKSQILAHPNIVSVHDFDRDGSVIYMTMEILNGVDLERHIKRYQGTGLPREDAFKIIKDYCAALIYAHQKDIVHSDFKPSNIFLTKEGAKVLDFGIARVSQNAPPQDNFDAGSLGALTPAYASLEMLRREPPDQRDDVYAAAVIAYELLAGAHPFDNKSALQALNENLTPPRITYLSNRQWRALESGLKLRRRDRTPTVKQFLADLTDRSNNRLLKLAAIPVTLLLAAFGYFAFVSQSTLTQGVDATIKKGMECLGKKDYSCSKDSANLVLKLDSQNKQARELLQQTEVAVRQSQEMRFFEAASACLTSNDLDCAKKNLASLTQLNPTAPQATQLQQAIDLKVAQDSATRCFSEQNFDCVKTQSAQVLEKDPTNQVALDLQKRLKDMQLAVQAKAEKEAHDYAQAISQAENCLHSKDYACTQQSAKNALALRANDTKATGLYQKAVAAQQQIIDAKYHEQLARAESCFNRKDYDCTMQFSQQAKTTKPNDAKADTLYKKAAAAVALMLEAKYSEAMSGAESCFNKGDFDCSIRLSNQALGIRPADAKATTLSLQSTEAKDKLIALRNKATSVFEQGQTCFKSKDYNCAISKSDEALKIMPDYKDAANLKKVAQQELDKQRPVWSSDY